MSCTWVVRPRPIKMFCLASRLFSRYVLGYNTNMVKRNEAPKCYEKMLEPIEE
jgi:hypothetical protein